MDITRKRDGSTLIVKPQGRIDSNNAHDFHNSLTDAIADSDRAVIMNLSELSYISSAGLRAVLLTAKAMQKQDAKFILCALKGSIKGIFEVSGFNKIIDIHDTEEDALKLLNG